MFGYLAQCFKKDLVDPLDKPPNRRRTLARIFEFLVKYFFIQPSDEVANGCATSLIEILENTFPEYLTIDYNLSIMKEFIKPILKLVSATGANAQVSAACFCLRKMVQFLIKDRPELVTHELA